MRAFSTLSSFGPGMKRRSLLLPSIQKKTGAFLESTVELPAKNLSQDGYSCKGGVAVYVFLSLERSSGAHVACMRTQQQQAHPHTPPLLQSAQHTTVVG
jgi:hypothetical protein